MSSCELQQKEAFSLILLHKVCTLQAVPLQRALALQWPHHSTPLLPSPSWEGRRSALLDKL